MIAFISVGYASPTVLINKEVAVSYNECDHKCDNDCKRKCKKGDKKECKKGEKSGTAKSCSKSAGAKKSCCKKSTATAKTGCGAKKAETSSQVK